MSKLNVNGNPTLILTTKTKSEDIYIYNLFTMEAKSCDFFFSLQLRHPMCVCVCEQTNLYPRSVIKHHWYLMLSKGNWTLHPAGVGTVVKKKKKEETVSNLLILLTVGFHLRFFWWGINHSDVRGRIMVKEKKREEGKSSRVPLWGKGSKEEESFIQVAPVDAATGKSACK